MYLLYVMKHEFNKLNLTSATFILPLVLQMLLGGCTTPGESKVEPATGINVEGDAPNFEPVTFDHEMGAVGDVIRACLEEKTEQLEELDTIIHLKYYDEWKFKKR